MGWRFRKSVKVFPGVRVNLGRDGISSVSAGGRDARVSVGKRGVRQTVSLPGSGLSYSTFEAHKPAQAQRSTAGQWIKTLIMIPVTAIMLIVAFFTITTWLNYLVR